MKNNGTMWRRLSFLVVSALVFAVLAGSFYAFRHYRLREQAMRWRTEGLQAAQNKDWPTAVDRLTLYLQRFPSDQQALVAYADARPHVPSPHAAHIGDTIRALNYLLQLNPSANDRRLQLLDLYQHIDANTETIETATRILNYDPLNRVAFDGKSAAQIRIGQYSDAMATTTAWLKARPLDIQAESRLIALSVTQGNGIGAMLAQIDAWSTANPNNPARTQLYKSLAYAAVGNVAQARVWLRQARADAPHNSDFDEALVTQFSAIGENGEDVAVLKQIVADGTDDVMRYSLVKRLWENGQPAQAASAGAALDPHDPSIPADVLGIMALSYRTLQHPSAAQRYCDALATRDDTPAIAWRSVLDTPPQLAGDQNRRLIDSLKTALGESPQDGYLICFLGDSLQRSGETQLAIDAWQRAATSCPTWNLPLAQMATALLSQGELSDAAQAANAAYTRCPNLISAMAVVQVVAAMDQHGMRMSASAALTFIDELSKAAVNSEELDAMRVQFLCRLGREQDAIAFIRNRITKPPAPSDACLLQFAQLSRDHHLGLEDELLNADEELHGITPNLALARAMQVLQSGHRDAALQLIDHARPNSPDSSDLSWQLVRARFLDAADSPAAAAAWEALGETHPLDLSVQEQLLAASCLQHNRPVLEATLQRMDTILGPQSLVCALARAKVLIATRRDDSDDRAIADLLRGITAAHPRFAEPHLLWAANLQQQGKLDDAIGQLQLAANLSPQSPTIALELARLNQLKGNNHAALEHLTRAETLGSMDSAQAVQDATLRASLNDPEGALKVLNGMPSRPADADLLMANLLWRTGRLEQADQLFTSLLKDPSAATIASAVRFYDAVEQPGKAKAALAELDRLNLSQDRRLAVEADAAVSSGNGNRALTLLRQATAIDPKNPVPWRALVAQLYAMGLCDDARLATDTGLRTAGADPTLLALQASAASLTAVRGFPELAPVVDMYVRAPLAQPAARDVIEQASQAAFAKDSTSSLAVVAAMSQLYPDWDAVQIWAMDTDQRTRRPIEAGAAAAAALNALPQSASVAQAVAIIFANEAAWSQALGASQRWHTLAPMDWRANVAVAQDLLALGRAKDAVVILEPLAPTSEKDSTSRPDLVLIDAQALCAAGESDNAAKLIWPLAQQDAKWRLAAIDLAARHLDAPTARRWLEQLSTMIDKHSTDEMAALGNAWAVLSTKPGADGPDCLKNANNLFDAIVARPDATASSLEFAGMLFEQLRAPEQAIGLYQRVLALDPNRLVAQNNLAILLARRHEQIPKAIQLAQNCTAAAPQEPEFLDTLAFVDKQSGNLAGATDCIRRAVDLEPENLRWRIELGRLLVSGGNRSEAANVVASIDLMPIDPEHLSPAQRHDLAALRAEVATSAAGHPASVQ